MSKVTVKDFTPDTIAVGGIGEPTLLCRWCASLPCGCCVWVGIRFDNQEAATAVVPHSALHKPLAHRFNGLLAVSTLKPSDRDLIDVVAELLKQAADA